MGFDYKKYSEIVEKINSSTDLLNKQNEECYMSYEAKDALCKIIREANRLNTYIRHYKNK